MHKFTIRKQIVLCLIIGFNLSTISSTYAAERADYDAPASTEETTGFFSGLLLGGLAGGPPGVVIGGALGAIVGDGWHSKKRVGDMQADLYESQLELAMMREQNEILQQEYQLARAQMDDMRTNAAQYQQARLVQTAPNNCCDNTVLSLHFRTGSATIESQYEEQIESLVNIAKHLPSARVEITGYADRNGDADRNLALSRQRSESVKRLLGEFGVADSTITTIAYGEAKPLQSTQSFESDFFDRRVIVRLRDTSKQMLTQTPEGN